MQTVKYNEDESEIEGFYCLKSTKQVNTSINKGKIDKFLKKQGQNEIADEVTQDNDNDNNYNRNLLGQKDEQNSDDFDMMKLLSVHQNEPKVKLEYTLPVEVEEHQTQQKGQTAKRAQTTQKEKQNNFDEMVDHSSRRPRVVPYALKEHKIFCNETLKKFTKLEFNQYIKEQGGKVTTLQKSATIIIYDTIKPSVDKILQKAFKEDDFYNYLIKLQIKQLQYELNGPLKKNYHYITSNEDITNIINNLEQQPYPECMNEFTIKDINKIMKKTLQEKGLLDDQGKRIMYQQDSPNQQSSTQLLLSSPSPKIAQLSPKSQVADEVSQDDKMQQDNQALDSKITYITDNIKSELEQTVKYKNTSQTQSLSESNKALSENQDDKPSHEHTNLNIISDQQKSKPQQSLIQKLETSTKQIKPQTKQQINQYEEPVLSDVWKVLKQIQPTDEFDGRFSFTNYNRFVEKLELMISQREQILLSGPTGCGKALLLEILLKKKGYNVITCWDATTAVIRLRSGSLFATSQQLGVILRNIQHCSDLSHLTSFLRGKHASPNYLVCTSDNVYNSKLKIVKTYLNEIKMPQIDTENAILVTSKMLKPYYQNNYPSAYKIEQLINNLAQVYNQDIRQCLIQLGFSIFGQQHLQSQQLFVNQNLFQITETIFSCQDIEKSLESYYIDSMMLHGFLIQNYLKMIVKGNHQMMISQYLADSLSDSDVEQFKMFRISDWSGFPVAQKCVVQIATTKKYIAKSARIEFPSTILQLKTQNLDFYYNDDQILSPYENLTATELGLNILDASFFLGLDPELQDDMDLHMGIGSNISNILKIFKLKYCVGAKKTQLSAFVSSNSDLNEIKQKKGDKKK